jgi:peptidoglycan-N-acetylglucosamine deacetylase
MELETEVTPTNTSVRTTEIRSGGSVAEPIINSHKARPTIVTTSWDDGNHCDLKVAEILRARQVGGTFYVPITPHEKDPALSHAQLRDLSAAGFEIGAHGFSHKLLWKLSNEELAAEIAPCRPALEDIIGAEVRMFCYPKGRYDANTIQCLKQAGYQGARSNRMLSTRLDFDPFAMPTTVQISHSRSGYIKNALRAGKLEALRFCVTHVSRLDNWVELGKKLFDHVVENGGVWHLYGHSHEIQDQNLWKELEEIVDYVSRRQGVRYVPNCELVCAPVARARHAGNGKL